MKKYFTISSFSLFFALVVSQPVSAATLGQKLSGKILLQVETHGEAWYVNPTNNKRYFLGRPTDVFLVMKTLGIGISNEDLRKIPLDLTLFQGTDTDSD